MNLHGSHLRDCNVYSHVPLNTFDQGWVGDVFLNNTLLLILKVINVIDDRDASSPAHIGGFADP